jgi:hypothetical protein
MQVELQQKLDYKFPADAGFACRTASLTAALIRDMIEKYLCYGLKCI